MPRKKGKAVTAEKTPKGASAALTAAPPTLLDEAPTALDESAAQPKREAAVQVPLSAAHRANPTMLAGKALHDLAHQRGMSRSDLARMPDEKVREQMRYLVHRQYDTVEA